MEKKTTHYSDGLSIGLLLILYTIQGVPMGINAAVPYLLQHKISYASQSLLTFISMPFSFKLLWAPIVDAFYFKSIGQRKSWLVPVQIASGTVMIWGGLSGIVEEWLGHGFQPPKVSLLFTYFSLLYFLCATQDIAVDGWSLTMLSPSSISYAAPCNAAGQMIGYNLSFAFFLLLNDPATCNRYFRSIPSDVGLVTMGHLLTFWGCITVMITILVAFFKDEIPADTHVNELLPVAKTGACDISTATEGVDGEDSMLQKLLSSYTMLWKLSKLKAVRRLGLVLLTCRIAFACTDVATNLKMVEYGLSLADVGMLVPLLAPTTILSNILASKLSMKHNPLNLFYTSYPLRLLIGMLCNLLVVVTALVYRNVGDTEAFRTPYPLLGMILLMTSLYSFCADLMFTSLMIHFTRISDPLLGGTYMTLLNTVSNLGGKWPQSVVLYLIHATTIKSCTPPTPEGVVTCSTLLDGFFPITIVSVIFGVVWMRLFKEELIAMNALPASDWRVPSKTETEKSE